MMGKFSTVAGKPTASKGQGVYWYYPAVTCAYGRPKRLPHGGRHETRGKAKAEARRIIKAQEEGEV